MVPSPVPTRSGPVARVVKWTLGTLILLVALVLPYRARIGLSEWMGRIANAAFTGYVRLVAWLIRKLQEPAR